MQARSARFDSTIASAHRSVVRVTAFQGGVKVATLQPIDGDVTQDRTATIRTSGRIIVSGLDGLVPETGVLGTDQHYSDSGSVYGGSGGRTYGGYRRDQLLGLLSPFKTEVLVERGLRYDDGTMELLAVARLQLVEVSVIDEATSFTIELLGYDRSYQVSRALFLAPYVITAGQNYVTAIQNMLRTRLPSITFDSATTTEVTPKLVLGTRSRTTAHPWQDAQELAKSIGMEVFFNSAGVCVIRPLPDSAGATSVYAIKDGENGTLVKLRRKFSSKNSYSAVKVMAENSSVRHAPSVIVYDTAPASPTYYLGSFGIVPLVIRSPFISTESQARTMANAQLREKSGYEDTAEFSVVTNPALEASDLVTCTRGKSALSGDYIVDQLSIPLRPNAQMTGTTRRRRTS